MSQTSPHTPTLTLTQRHGCCCRFLNLSKHRQLKLMLSFVDQLNSLMVHRLVPFRQQLHNAIIVDSSSAVCHYSPPPDIAISWIWQYQLDDSKQVLSNAAGNSSGCSLDWQTYTASCSLTLEAQYTHYLQIVPQKSRGLDEERTTLLT